MKKVFFAAAIMLCGAFTSGPIANAAESSFVLAQGVDISVRPSGERMERPEGGERMERREYRERVERREPSERLERREVRTRRVVRVEHRRQMYGCRTVISRRMTANGSVTRRVRSCR